MAIPYLIYFYENYKSPYPEGLTHKIQLEEILLRKMLEYHYSYGVTGFLSERSTLQGIFEKIGPLTEQEWKVYVNPPKWQMMTLAIEGPDDEEEAKKNLEASLGDKFGGWWTKDKPVSQQ